MEDVYTTGEVARFTGVNFRTVIRWIERGELKGYKLPGRGDHRVQHSALLAFMAKNNIPVPAELQETKQKVLVVDDDIAMASAIARIFKRLGWQVEQAHDGFEAGMLLASFEPSIMTLDLKMPYMDGFNVLAVSREKFKQHGLKIIVISAQGKHELNKALEQGADAVLEKPFENETLKQLIDKLSH
ncbi:response regulator [Oceaniserpentilla sp. 4NH20-0058]|uniref:response regulator n=1 Tax=Oceaniserpentilla sp. 4NH20-0058 TaxID=3127660 RepID=UPI003105C906